jgi:predicted ester cyclase
VSEENKAIARRVYEIVSRGDVGQAREILDEDAPDNELLPDHPPAKLMETFKETFAEARETFPDLSVAAEGLIAEGDRVARSVSSRAAPIGESSRGSLPRASGWR